MFNFRNGYIEAYCKYLTTGEAINATTDAENHELYIFSQLFQKFFLPSNDSCVQMDYEGDIKELKKDYTKLAFAFRPWYYQTCSGE